MKKCLHLEKSQSPLLVKGVVAVVNVPISSKKIDCMVDKSTNGEVIIN